MSSCPDLSPHVYNDYYGSFCYISEKNSAQILSKIESNYPQLYYYKRCSCFRKINEKYLVKKCFKTVKISSEIVNCVMK